MTRKATHQLTIRFDDALARKLHEHAKKTGLSLNRAAIRLLESAVGLQSPKKDVIGHSLDHLFGGWSEEEARQFEEYIADLGRPDPEMLK